MAVSSGAVSGYKQPTLLLTRGSELFIVGSQWHHHELRDEPHNEYLRLFASRQRVRQNALRRLDPKASAAIWTVVFALQKAYELEGADMNSEMTVESLLALGEEMRKQVVASAPIEERLAGLAPEELRLLLKQIETYLQAQSQGEA